MTLFVLCITLIIASRTVMYGIWTIKEHNITGGVFVLVLAIGTLSLAARYFFKA